ncbi:DUF4893 domain-containing protein [Caulobacter segnis]|uniref:DUF4893 domain-containing protein n=2 Tax=Caulobacter segnis TaxID=88688 RepID=D5VMW8_CAUST|nr:DUF4893 domain-containing protein [Caulobacter segnis]ADG11841.1 conserved hypothetical protein [Caulobacter segnis ATCC 21756]AVQ03472.1 DUF4893 domain-containing protein [Caulobacter segnis]
MRLAAALALSIFAAGSASAAFAAASGDWRADAKPGDVRRLERLDQAWSEALAQARAGGYGRQVKALGAVTDPRVSLSRPQPTPGSYRCRTIKLGSPNNGLPFVAYGWFRCRVALTPGGDLVLEKVTGSQRQSGNLYPEAPRRLVFLGAVAWGVDEGRARYGRDSERDQVGVFERIGAGRYRLALPWPKQESKLDLLELRR